MNFPDFSTYFNAVWGYPPFAWQIRFAADAMRGRWPAWVALPTGLGKTSLIDIAIYALAAQAHLPAHERTAPVRIIFAVNRRIVVDEAFRRTEKITSALKDCVATSPLASVSEALRRLSGGDAPPLETYPLRGATFTDGSWARSATQPLVVTTTLDQIGSRLLFRGYGCSERARPIHAALLAHDALILLDEAHTSRAFSETLAAITRWRAGAAEPLHLPFHTVQLTATPPADTVPEFTFSLTEDEKSEAPVRRRLHAGKPVALQHLPGAVKRERHKKLASACRASVETMLAAGARRILIVLNRVESAKTARDALSDIPGCRAEILTGGLRPLDRERLVNSLINTHCLQSGEPPSDVPRLVLVATQCVEVGADLDFDALITELAPLDALRQRFGRLNRYGRPITARAVILAPDESLAADDKNPDPIYGSCLPKVWGWLKRHETGLDFGISALDPILPTADELPSLLGPQPLPPVLLPAHLDLLCQTSPAPHREPSPSLYIHGPRRDFPTVEIVLRRNLLDGSRLSEMVDAILEAMPPLGTEAASLSLFHVRRWLAGEKSTHDDDAPTTMESERHNPNAPAPPAGLIHRTGEVIRLDRNTVLRPGDMLVLPVETPAIDRLIPGLADGGERDQAEEAHLLARDRVLLDLSEPRLRYLSETLGPEDKERFDNLLAPVRMAEAQRKADGHTEWFARDEWQAAIPGLLELFEAVLIPWKDRLENGMPADLHIEHHPLGGVIARSRYRVGYTHWPLIPAEIRGQNDGGGAVSLMDHQADVEKRVAASAGLLGFTGRMLSTLRDAARNHDAGKTDPRFQAWLRGIQSWAVAADDPIAKSNQPAHLISRLRDKAGVPGGFRHELLSTLIVAASRLAADHPERDLLLHLIASHHGYCRASAPVVSDESPEDFDAVVDGESVTHTGRTAPLANFGEGVPDRFWKLTRRFGWWGLAYLESLVRLADQQASATPSRP